MRVHDAPAQEPRPTCANFRYQSDAQATFTADPSDPFGLDGDNNGVACQGEDLFGTTPLVNCDDLRDHPDAQQALQGLYDYTRAAGDPYTLDADGNGIACDGDDGTGDRRDDREELDGLPESGSRDQEELDGPAPDRSRDDQEDLDRAPPVTSRGPNVVSAVPLGTGETLETRLKARFAALEAQFAAFEARAANGFGMFPDAEDDATAGGQVTTIGVSTSLQPIAVTQRTRANDDSPIIRAQKAKDGHGERGRERKGKRDRDTGKQRNGR